MKKSAIIKLIIFIIIVLAVIIMAVIESSKNKESLSLKTEDGYLLSYNYNYVSDKAVILIHMLANTKESYSELTDFLNKKGYSTIAIDLRGHGKSTGNLNNFNNKDYQSMLLDIKAAKNFLQSKNMKDISIVGASIGANLAVNFASNSNINKVVMLSPGKNYHEIIVENILNNCKNPILFVAAKDDIYSYNSTQFFNSLYKGPHKFISFATGGHGTNLLITHPELKQTILDFLDE